MTLIWALSGCAFNGSDSDDDAFYEYVVHDENGVITERMEYLETYNIWFQSVFSSSNQRKVVVFDGRTNKIIGEQFHGEYQSFLPKVVVNLNSISSSQDSAYFSVTLPPRVEEFRVQGFLQTSFCDLEFADGTRIPNSRDGSIVIPHDYLISNSDQMPYVVMYFRFSNLPFEEAVLVLLPSYFNRFNNLETAYPELFESGAVVFDKHRLLTSWELVSISASEKGLQFISPTCD